MHDMPKTGELHAWTTVMFISNLGSLPDAITVALRGTGEIIVTKQWNLG